jgi:hypothetical protein
MRKHKKNRGITKQGIESVEVKPAKTTTERKVVQNATTGEFEVVHVVTTVPAVVKQGKAYDRTTTFGKPNTGGLGGKK